MAFPKRLLIPGEELVLDLRPHWVALSLAALVAAAELVVGFWIISKLNGVVNWFVFAAMVVLLFLYPVRRLVDWLTRHFVLTSERVISREGFVAKRSVEIPLEKINDIRFNQNVIERVVGAGNLVIRSASEDGPTTFKYVRNPEEVQKALYHEAEKNSQRMFTGRGTAGAPVAPAAPPTPPAAPSQVTELERLADLRAKGVLTEEEFQAQKAKILGQP
jgi:uncharacterized membrane protein YdbT with pleckstrin-like domain